MNEHHSVVNFNEKADKPPGDHIIDHSFINRITITALLVFCACCLIPGMGLYDFFTRGEAREALMVQDILGRGDWILPRGYGDRISTKPPALHWAAASISLVSGSLSEFTVRLPSALFSALALCFFLFLLRRELNETGKWIFIGILVFSFEWLRASLSARVDMVHAASLSTGLLAAFLAIEHNKPRLWVLSSLLLGLATMGKGPVALVLSTLILGTWILLMSKNKLTAFVRLGLCSLGSFTIAAPWYLAAYHAAPEEFWAFFHYESIARFASTMEDSPHSHSVFYLAGVLLLGILPWTPLIATIAFRHMPRSLSGLKGGFLKGPPLVCYSILVIGVVFVFYAIPSSKRSVYLLACYPFIALASALTIQQHGISARGLRAFKLVTLGMCIAVLFAQAVALPFFIVPRQSERKVAEALLPLRREGESVFSYGFEFYGTSFYTGLKLFRIPLSDDIEVFKLGNYPAMKPSDLVIFFEKDLEAVNRELSGHGLRANVVISAILLGRKKVSIGRIG